jgi:tetratricopeptide (TPR) repeat protein
MEITSKMDFISTPRASRKSHRNSDSTRRRASVCSPSNIDRLSVYYLPMLFRVLLILSTSVALLRAETQEFMSAMELVRAKRYPEARPLLEKVVANEPKNAVAWYQLGMVWRGRHDTAAYEEAAKCLRTASELEPNNARYLADFGGTLLELANRNRSITAATTGRDAMEKAVTLNPADVDAREGLFQYYLRAPFFVGGSNSKATAQLDEIRRLAPDRAIALSVLSKADAKDYDGAFKLCEAELERHPSNYTALYQYGRTASLSGQNLPRGLECLQKALTIDPPNPASPTHSHIWFRVGDIQQKLGRFDEARAAYKSALEIDPANRLATAALERLK